MDPFNLQNDINTLSNQLDVEDEEIIIQVKSRGRKCTTNISGWNIDLTEMKGHLKKLKVTNGCNGTIKTEDGYNNMLLQGNLITIVKDYMIKNGVNENDITIKE